MRLGPTRIAMIATSIVCSVFGEASSAADPGETKAPRKGRPRVEEVQSEEAKAKLIAGWLEWIEIPAAKRVAKAKLDSGAKTSSIHATNIKEFKRNGQNWVRFDLPASAKGDEPVTLERRRVRRVQIKDHDDPAARRPVVTIEVCFDGQRYEPQFTLADRGNFLYPVLLGRRFLAGVAVIDPAEKYLTSSKCLGDTEE